ncbi:TetR/AcrR family transcriptional regulator [Actinoplanes flavus]|uniref:TetR/AcrR family transcriptional regulator C-terminal domain-containing protein n=1 Tax=Actinoplanes flavus TaxID=2820290 RepID=A0ABS3UJ81_9ACTN|nr:TetR/AcrR family transcriptional regulator C-terminal domain-containing protein [Actinoplanes flavus]MBO3738840.1 TetR/AcrR family transcriptional regulator C-terminal domain-containing protein [Actinoplanes flavus]
MSPARRTESLSREVVVTAAIELLDEHGERGFTFKLLTERLRTGAGAVYWHVANKEELVRLCADRVLGDALAAAGPEQDLRSLALSVYDALDRHSWAARHVIVLPSLPHALHLLDRIGTLLTGTPLPAERRFLVATAIFNYVVSVTAQDVVRVATVDTAAGRDALLAAYAKSWESLDPQTFPFLTGAATDLREHDDRDQFVTGLDLLLDGLRHQSGGGQPGEG